VAAAVRFSEVRVDGEAVVWSEGRPAEGGRTQLVRREGDGATADVLPPDRNARTAVHEYGGAAWWVHEGVTWFVDWADQRLYRLEPGGEPIALTPRPAVDRGDRFADGDVAPDGRTIVCVRERHAAGGGLASARSEGGARIDTARSEGGARIDTARSEGGARIDTVRNEIVRLDARVPGKPEVLVTGSDFVAAPRLSPDGGTLAWLQWQHPDMPWDATLLTVRDLETEEETVVAGGAGESVLQPVWEPGPVSQAGRPTAEASASEAGPPTAETSALWFLSDRTGWWNLYRWVPGTDIEHVVRIDAEIGAPASTLGGARYTVLADGRVVFARWRGGFDGLAVREPDGTVADLDLPFTAVAAVRALGPHAVVVVAGTPTQEFGVHRVDLGAAGAVFAAVTPLRPPRELGLDPALLSTPEAVSFPSAAPDGAPRTAHALFYPPANPAFRGPDGELPPLLVVIHGGPTAAAVPVLSLELQYWTSRGFAVVDVNYAGSSGYGRPYRELLNGQWGVLDVTDCLAAARWLARSGRVDGARLCIRGGSAGGFTTLLALARADTLFAAGADYFGVADLESLAVETHKFESRYLDRLIGPYPQAREVYVERSPLTHVDQFSRPLIVLQGSEDAIVPPKQSEMIVEALRAKRVPVAYLLFVGEQHGFRRAENQRRALDAELSFYAQVLGFELPPEEGIEPVVIENL
jgi:dipeptidyl aminopeptidase/acylaminoacyl peptidase